MLLAASQTYSNAGDNVFSGAVQTVTTNSNVFAADTTNLVCHLHVSAVSGTTPSLTVKLQDSGNGVDWVDIPSAAFAAVTAAGSQRVVVTNVGSMVRAVSTISGTTPSLTVTLTAVGRN